MPDRLTSLGAALLLTSAVAAQGYRPDEAAAKMTVTDGFRVRLVASEPTIRQPVAMEFDDRGRLWVIQYLQYPNPAGLKRVDVDRYSRTKYDRVPEPPPRGPKGADRITILDDFGPDGRARHARDFVGGLNLASGLAFGHGGVFVLQVPYLLFYPDRDRDDMPDSDPDVLLTGFGMDDAHSVANSLTWGPDGWLYGCQGSTVTANIRGIEFQQGVWRYHPLTRKFELFCEGGGNSWGLDFDHDGHLIYSTNFGGHVALHGVQGGYYWKLFGKHGALHNPFAYGHIEHLPHRHFTGGHVTAGGVVYQGDAFPERFQGKYVGADLLGHAVRWHDLTPDGSSFRTAHGGNLLQANDTWFAPCDVTIGPDGAVYVADWHDKRTAHPDPDAEWDRSNGRVYKVEPLAAKPVAPFDIAKLSRDSLLSLLTHPNAWFARKAREELAQRRDPETIFPLRRRVAEGKDARTRLTALWALHVSGGFSDAFAEECLGHRDATVRRWAVRLLGDEGKASSKMMYLAEADTDVHVRSQLACTAKRLPAKDGLAIVARLLRHKEDINDPQIPLLLWWAVEAHALAARDETLAFFASAEAWRLPLARAAILERLMRRYATENTDAGFRACARLLRSAPDPDGRSRLLAALDRGLGEIPNPRSADMGPPGFLWEAVNHGPRADGAEITMMRLAMRFGRNDAQQRFLFSLHHTIRPAVPPPMRLAIVQAIAEFGGVASVDKLLKLLEQEETEAFHLAVLAALQRFSTDDIAEALLKHYPKMTPRLKAQTVEVLLSRRRWANFLLVHVGAGFVPLADIPIESLRRVATYKDPNIDLLVRKHWGNIGPATAEEKLAEVRRFNNDLRAAKGDAVAGRVLFRQHCATCHKLHGEGEATGPDLTHANRKDRDYLLTSIVDPSAVVRKEYLAYTVQTTDGRVLTGLVVAQTPADVTLVNAKNERTTLPRTKIESMQESLVSLMPENLLKTLKPQELRDLFAYLQQ